MKNINEERKQGRNRRERRLGEVKQKYGVRLGEARYDKVR